MGLIKKIFFRTKEFIWNSFPARNWFAGFLLNMKKVLLTGCCTLFVILTSSSTMPLPRAQQGIFPRFSPYSSSYTSSEVHNPTYWLSKIKRDIEQKRVDSVRTLLCYEEAQKRIEYGSYLVLLDQTANRSLYDRVFLNAFLEAEIRLLKSLYEAFCVLATDLYQLDESLFLLTGDQSLDPINSNGNGSLQIHRRSQVHAISLNFQHQTDRTVSISGSGNHSILGNPRISGSGNHPISGNPRLSGSGNRPISGSGNALIVRDAEHVFLPPWQNPPGLF